MKQKPPIKMRVVTADENATLFDVFVGGEKYTQFADLRNPPGGRSFGFVNDDKNCLEDGYAADILCRCGGFCADNPIIDEAGQEVDF